MPSIILKAGDFDGRSSFSVRCGREGFIPVIGTINRGKIDIDADAHALEGEYEDLRLRLQADPTPIIEVFQSVCERMQPKHTWSRIGYYSSINRLDKEVAQMVAEILAEELDALAVRIR